MAMMDLSCLDWRLYGWRPFVWKLGKTMETGFAMAPDVGPVDTHIPASVQQTLLEADVIEDWNVGLRSRDCEWIEHRHWDFTATIPAGAIPAGERVVLDAQGLDYSGWILVDTKEVAQFEGAVVTHRFDLTEALSDDEAHELSIVFDEPPREQGQIGYTSRSHYFKPRYPYSWDWCPRVVPVGIWDALALKWGPALAMDLASVRTDLAEDLETGSLEVDAEVGGEVISVAAILYDGDQEVARVQTAPADGRAVLRLEGLAVEAWWPNGHGAAKTYSLVVEADAGGDVWREERSVGFRRVEWLPCEDAPEGAEPWICSVNGDTVFLQGANWVPPRVTYHDATEGEYRQLIDLYRDMGCTILRVWGGGILEKEIFYRLCDEAGIMVWQEFPLSSSGVDNWPPEDPETLMILTTIVASYIRRRAHHPSLAVWCGGNELLGGGEGGGEPDVPVDYTHPCVAAMRAAVEHGDPGRRFLPTSASGPCEWGHRADFGKGIHHDVHGPWGFSPGCEDMAAWKQFWAEDDSLIRSEVGMPGAMSAELFARYGDGQAWPPTTEYWNHLSGWWTQWERFREDFEDLPADQALTAYIERTRADQAEAYAAAASACKARFPKCGGFIIWMGHDCFPCPANNAVIDFDRQPKPAYFALKEVFRGE
jgi:beta-mannosidase